MAAPKYTQYQTRYFAEQLSLKRPQSSVDNLASAMSGTKVDLNPHQVDAALFALRSPLSSGALLADEVGLGKTIEAGLVLSQFWAERKRKILLIVPASLRMQWRQELTEKFFIDSILMEATPFNKAKREGKPNPFDIDGRVVICSYNFAARKDAEIRTVPWDLVIMDEAHRLRNVYKKSNVTGKKLKRALDGRKKLLLTATPLQNNLMELYGLASIIDDHAFGDARTFRDMYVTASNVDLRNKNLKDRLQHICHRTLRKQVTEYIRYTNRHAILQEYAPSAEEEELYNGISDYLQSDKLYALPQGQRTLITMVLRKLLASSSFAISGTLSSLIERLEGLLAGVEGDLDMSDYDAYGDLMDGNQDEEDIGAPNLVQERDKILLELERLNEYASLANSITHNAKGDNLLFALEKGFAKIEELGGKRKAVIFTESRRTQEYLLRLLSDNGYEDKIVFLNGSNNDEVSKRIYEDWKQRHDGDGAISGSRQADMKAAVVEEFRDRASILIGTEAAAEGINLQFCSLLVNYDLPWNPQRIEQRIGRCHRYGQKNDVVVINFLNKRNAADVRVYELLSEKFNLFNGVFGSSDEVIGSIESGVDFEKRIAGIYQKCKTSDEIQAEFDALQDELAESIDEKMVEARHSILENFDEDVAARLKDCQTSTVASLDKFSQWTLFFLLAHGAERVTPENKLRFRFGGDPSGRVYNLQWRDAEDEGDTFLRRDDPRYLHWIDEAKSIDLPFGSVKFLYSNSDRRVSYLDEHPGIRGVITIDKLSYSGIGEEEHLVITAVTDDGRQLDEDLVNTLFELPAELTDAAGAVNGEVEALRKERVEQRQRAIEAANKQYYLDECAKLDAYSEDLKEGLQRELNDIKKAVTEKNREFRNSTDLPLDEMLAVKDELEELKRKRKRMQRDLYDREDEIEAQNEQLQAEMREKLRGNSELERIMTISFEVE
ncbi:SNF2-related protein [uncultured Collinsella sp.]|uniref:SNF2-related protein n=1 Tax=uncultured Collinsella sp. TaxID=165190 RepID=UPI00267156E8|nr:SNF2-related protein [uncultured Collinsella sp.]